VYLAELGPDEPLKYVQTEANRSALASFTTAERPWTAGELAHEIGLGGRGPVLVGSATEVADELERWVDEADIDGFNLAYVTTPGT
ncbi:5,10-methylene tetrahydromethanopterin reductase, partial [Mycobacterium tuberculosis]